RLANTGNLRTFTIVHRAAKGIPTPYVSCVVDLDGGGVVKANLVQVEPDPDHVRLGMRVELATFPAGNDDDGTEAIAFGYRPAEEDAA
ncbi:MAG TPA: OB-fold domain-containing protein, partial [Acidimicrobiia bacterium]|nr:OB-fold domain-containing protein [Acidimicrobiia bacterium]